MPDPVVPPAASPPASADIAALAKGGRTNFFGFLLRLAARLPFLFIAGRLYGTESLGRFASAVVAVEIAAQLATLGQKRGLAQLLQREERPPACIVADALLVSFAASALLAAILWAVPAPMYPSGGVTPIERLLPLVIFPLVVGDIALAALAFRYDIATTVRARSLVEPWVLSIAAGLLWFVLPDTGMVIAYFLSITAAMAVALWALVKSYGLPRNWSPEPLALGRQAWPKTSHANPTRGAMLPSDGFLNNGSPGVGAESDRFTMCATRPPVSVGTVMNS